MNWIEYSFNNLKSRPPSPGRYLIYRQKCNKIQFEQWNGSGWSNSNNDCTHWCIPKSPKTNKIIKELKEILGLIIGGLVVIFIFCLINEFFNK
jgi:hypothetical protein